MKLKQRSLNYLLDLVIKNIRLMDTKRLCTLKTTLHAFNASKSKWDSPNTRKATPTETEQ